MFLSLAHSGSDVTPIAPPLLLVFTYYYSPKPGLPPTHPKTHTPKNTHTRIEPSPGTHGRRIAAAPLPFPRAGWSERASLARMFLQQQTPPVRTWVEIREGGMIKRGCHELTDGGTATHTHVRICTPARPWERKRGRGAEIGLDAIPHRERLYTCAQVCSCRPAGMDMLGLAMGKR